MSREYKPRRCSKRWLDGDCPPEVLAIIEHPKEPHERYDVFYTETTQDGYEVWVSFFCLSEIGSGYHERGSGYHGELKAHELAAYRYRNKHRYAKWSDLPESVKRAVRKDLEYLKEV